MTDTTRSAHQPLASFWALHTGNRGFVSLGEGFVLDEGVEDGGCERAGATHSCYS